MIKIQLHGGVFGCKRCGMIFPLMYGIVLVDSVLWEKYRAGENILTIYGGSKECTKRLSLKAAQ